MHGKGHEVPHSRLIEYRFWQKKRKILNGSVTLPFLRGKTQNKTPFANATDIAIKADRISKNDKSVDKLQRY